MVDGACVFLNRPGFAGGQRLRAAPDGACGPACTRSTTKPDVCWQLPVRREQEHVDRPDGTRVLVTTLGEFDRRGWGAGRARPALVVHRVAGRARRAEPLVDTYAAELTALLGGPAYAELRRLVELRLDQGLVAPAPGQPRCRSSCTGGRPGDAEPARNVCR